MTPRGRKSVVASAEDEGAADETLTADIGPASDDQADYAGDAGGELPL